MLRTAMVIGALVATITVAWAITFAAATNPDPDPEECPGASPAQVFSGTMTQTGTTITIPVNLSPCETVGFSITTTGHQQAGALVVFRLFNSEASARILYQTQWASYGTVSQPNLPTGPPWIYPYRGTRGVEGLPSYATLYATFLSSFGHTLTYTVTVTKAPRSNYNLGGISFGDATDIQLDEKQYGTVHQWEPGQFYRLTVTPAQTIYVSGQVTGSSTHGTNFKIDIFDSNYVQVATLATVAAYGTVLFPPGATFPTFTPSVGNTEYYMRVTSTTWPSHDFQFEVKQSPCAVPTNCGVSYEEPVIIINSVPRLIFTYQWSSSTGNLADLWQCQIREKVVRPFGYAVFPSPPFAQNDWKPIPEYVTFSESATTGAFLDVHDTKTPFILPSSAISITSSQTYEYRCPCANSNNWVTMYTVWNGIKREFSQNAGGTWQFSISKEQVTATKTPIVQ